MSIIFEKLIKHAETFKTILKNNAILSDETHPFDWENKIYSSAYIRRAHLDIIDVRETKKLYMMHLCVFPRTWDPAPIYGFDLIAGPNKVTGAFHDFSPSGDPNHPMSQWFGDEVKKHSWSKVRELPDWAKNIFSDNMVAAGNIKTEFELDEVLDLSKRSLEYYMKGLYKYKVLGTYESKLKGPNYTDQQNKYCKNQKRNPHTPRVMASLGFDEVTIKNFIENCLFPEIE
jgi:hypothetical protein